MASTEDAIESALLRAREDVGQSQNRIAFRAVTGTNRPAYLQAEKLGREPLVRAQMFELFLF